MFNLIIKDILIQKKTVLFTFVYMLFLIVFLKEASFVSAMVMMSYILVITGFSLEEKNKSDIMLNSLPIKRRNIVLAKYLSVFIYFGIGVAAYFLTAIVVRLLGSPITIHSVTLEEIIGALFAITLLNGIYIPVLFRVGYTKSRVVIFVMFFLVFFLGAGFTKIISKAQSNIFIKTIVNFFTSKSDMQILVYLLGAIIIMILGSFLLSVKLYESREF
ncbi:ABC-2 transporter permease [Clostridium aciditolerans]|uniref:ABC-2 transporter permease n=1 Tax=Clostridium aciditolerans TaxID=339861 RepID=A0A934LZZ5_9CLOT|nr:ABC-2 transporter permease [Clostridium aciditolerans]MBI6871544.1 ABC-2 transporter permease [Clostridium aciditolerans]